MGRAAVLVVVFVVVALVDNPVTAVVVTVAAWGVLDYRRRRPQHPKPPPVARPGWGYEFPWVDLPGLAYVGITARAPYQLADGSWWCARWDDVDDDGRPHHIRRPDVRADLAVLYEFTSEVEAEAWETRRIAELATAGHTLLNIDKNPGRPCWERLGYDEAA
jgi:hypothetical protein